MSKCTETQYYEPDLDQCIACADGEVSLGNICQSQINNTGLNSTTLAIAIAIPIVVVLAVIAAVTTIVVIKKKRAGPAKSQAKPEKDS